MFGKQFFSQELKILELFFSGGHLDCLDMQKCKPFVKKCYETLQSVKQEKENTSHVTCFIYYGLGYSSVHMCVPSVALGSL